MDITIHINPKMPHQVEHGQWFAAGFKRHGVTFRITPSVVMQGDIHIVSGPHYALNRWRGHPRVLWLDRCYYRTSERPSGMISMPDVSLGWLREDGGRRFVAGSGKPLPKISKNYGEGTIFLADYNGPIEEADTIRLHPDQEKPTEDLMTALKRHDTAIGYKTTALITAALEGLNVICRDKTHILNEPNWRKLLPWADWNYSEIESGEAWEYLSQQL